MNERSKWLVLEVEDGWKIVIPESDIKPHAMLSEDEQGKMRAAGKGEAELAGLECPCKPTLDFQSRIISHNSFEDAGRIDEAMKKFN